MTGDICYHCTACDARGYGQVCWICGEAGHLVCSPLGFNGAFGPDYDNDEALERERVATA